MTSQAEPAAVGSVEARPLIERLPRLTRKTATCVLVGAVAGLGAIVFYLLLTASLALFLGELCHYQPADARGEPSPFSHWLASQPAQPRLWLLALMPAVGGLASGWLVFRFAPEAEGHGTDSAILAYHRKGGRIRGRIPLVKSVASAITIGTGGSGGREGPIAQIGAGFGSLLADVLRLDERDRRILRLAGLGAGVGAIFKAPLAGAVFAGEVLYRGEEFEHEALLPATVASVVAYSIFASAFGTQPLFQMAPLAFHNPLELLGNVVLGFVCAGTGWLYVRTFYGARRLFGRLPIACALRHALGGLLTGGLGLLMPAVLATGYGQIQAALDGKLTLGFLVALGLLKILATAFSIGSGGSGGVFGPAMVIGGAFGGATGIVCHRLGLIEHPGTMVLVGMAGFFAGAANTPISTIIMVSEMTGDYGLLVPCMVTSSIAAALLRRHSIYQSQEPGRRASAAHLAEYQRDALENEAVANWMERDPVTIQLGEDLSEVSAVFVGGHTRYPVLNHAGELCGVLDVRDVLRSLRAGQRDADVVAKLIDRTCSVIGPQLRLSEAAAVLDRDPHGLVCVVSEQGARQLLGVLRRQNLVHAYRQVKQGDAEPPAA